MSQRWVHPRVQALCCECGTVRTMSSRGPSMSGESLGATGDRCLALRKCSTCLRVTSHAFLRIGALTDILETLRLWWGQRPRLSEEDERWLLEAEIEQLVECGVRVERFDVGGGPRPDGRITLLWVTQFLDDGKWAVVVNQSQPSGPLRQALATFWSLAIAPDSVPYTPEELTAEPPQRARAISWQPSDQRV